MEATVNTGRPRTIRARLRPIVKTGRRWCTALITRMATSTIGALPFSITRRVVPFLTGVIATPLIRRKVHEHLGIAYAGSITEDEKRQITKRVARNLGLVTTEALAMSRGKLPHGYIDCEAALDTLAGVLREDQGFLALSAHTGNWECLGQVMFGRWPDQAAAVIARRNSNPFMNRLIVDTRRRLGMETIYQSDSPRRSLQLLRDGKIIATVPDQDIPRIAGIFVPFFGRPAYTPTGPAALAYAANVPICCGFTRRTAAGLELICPPPIWPNRKRPRKQEVARMTRVWSNLLEAHIREQPADWMWFHRRWRTTPERLAARRARKATG